MSESQTQAHAIVRATSLEEREFERWQVGIADRRRRLARLRVELDALRTALERFEGVVHARVGDLLVELHRLRRAIADHERRLGRPRVNPTNPSPSDSDDPNADPPPGWSDAAWDAATDAGAWEQAAADAAEAFVPRRTAKAEAEIKRLYLDLAKRCHPDHGRTDDERSRREALMQRVNVAFRDRDLPTLLALSREAEGTDPRFEDRPAREKLAWARQEVAWLDAELDDLRVELQELRAGELHRRWRRHEAGDPVLDRLEDDLQTRIIAEGARLDHLIAAYREAQADAARNASVAR